MTRYKKQLNDSSYWLLFTAFIDAYNAKHELVNYILTIQMLLRYFRFPITSSFIIRLLRNFRVSKSEVFGILDLSNNPGLALTHFTSTTGGSSGTCSWSVLLKEN